MSSTSTYFLTKYMFMIQSAISAFYADFPEALDKPFMLDIQNTAKVREGLDPFAIYKEDFTGFWGMCYYKTEPFRLVRLESFLFERLENGKNNEFTIMIIIYHELGHCLLDMPHMEINKYSIMKINQDQVGSANFNYALKVMREEYDDMKRKMGE